MTNRVRRVEKPSPQTMAIATGPQIREQPPIEPHTVGCHHASARYLWAMLLARIYEVFPLLCPHCGSEMRIAAFVTEAASVSRMLEHRGEPLRPPQVSPPRGPTAWEDIIDQSSGFDPLAAAPEPVFEFDQTVHG
jgi:hypothetical protein